MPDDAVNNVSSLVERVVSEKIDDLTAFIEALIAGCATKEQMAGIEKRLNGEHREILDAVNQNKTCTEDTRIVFDDKIQEIRKAQEEAKRAETVVCQRS